MNTKYFLVPLLAAILSAHSVLAVTMTRQPDAAGSANVDAKSRGVPKVQSVMSMGKLDAIDVAAQTFRINGVTYSFEGGVRFVNTNGRAMQAAQIKAGDWVQFWIKSSHTQRTPQVERVVLMVNPESRKAKP